MPVESGSCRNARVTAPLSASPLYLEGGRRGPSSLRGRSQVGLLAKGGCGADGVPSVCFQLPYEKDCKNKLFCVAELGVTSTISA